MWMGGECWRGNRKDSTLFPDGLDVPPTTGLLSIHHTLYIRSPSNFVLSCDGENLLPLTAPSVFPTTTHFPIKEVEK